MSTTAIVVYGIVFTLASGVATVLLLVLPAIRRTPRPGKVAASTEADPSEPFAFELSYQTPKAGSWRLFARLGRQGKGTGGGPAASVSTSLLGLTCHLTVLADDRQILAQALGFDGQPPGSVDRHVGSCYKSKRIYSGGEVSAEATFLLAQLPDLPAGTTILARGHFVAAPGTSPYLLNVFLTP